MIDKDTIKPKVKAKSDFFSWQLFRWVRKNPHECEIWKGTWNSFTGIDKENPVLYIGIMHDRLDFIGRQLTQLCRMDQNLQSFSLDENFDLENWENITEQFWKEYKRIGVCAIHGDNAHDWEVDGTLRTCNHCHKEEYQKVEMVERKYWEEMQ